MNSTFRKTLMCSILRPPTCHLGSVRESYSAEAVVGDGGDLTSAARAVMVIAVAVRMRHGVRVVRVQIITTLGTLEKHQSRDKPPPCYAPATTTTESLCFRAFESQKQQLMHAFIN